MTNTAANLTIATLGTHDSDAGLVAKALRIAPRPTPHRWTRQPIDLEAAIATLNRWVDTLDLDAVDAICWIPGHDRTPGPGHTTATIVAHHSGLPLVDACQRHTATASSSADGRQHWTHHARTLHVPSRHRPQRLALVDNTIGTGHSARAAIHTLTAAGHHVTNVIAASHAAPHQNRNRSMSIIDTPTGADFFCGSGGASDGVLSAGVDLRFAANHSPIAIATHSHLHPGVDHFQVDLLEYDIASLPAVQLAHFSPSCVHHSQANAAKVYEQPATLFDHINGTGPTPEARSGYAGSERSRVTMSCVLRYADAHHPPMMIVENVVEAAKWGPNRDGSTFRWWLEQLHLLGYKTRPMFLNSAAFGVPQKRDRMFVVCWDKRMRTPDLDHHVTAWCPTCERFGDARQVFRHRTKTWPMAEWGKLDIQYDYRCSTCHSVAAIAYTPASTVIDWTNLGTRLGDRPKPLHPNTIARIQHGIDRHHGELPAVTGLDHIRAMQLIAAGHTYERPGSHCRTRTLDEATWTQHTTAAVAIAAHHGIIVPFRKHTIPTPLDTPTFTQTAQQRPGLALWPAGAMFAKNNGGPTDTAYHATSDPFGTMTTRDTTSITTVDAPGPVLDINDVTFRMLTTDEVRKIMAYADNWKAVSPDPGKTPTKEDEMRLLGDGVTPPVETYLTQRILAIAA